MATDPPRAETLEVLRRGDVEVLGRMPWSSNRTFLVNVCCDGVDLPAVYKPGRGERSLWDFPGGLYRREVAAYELATALGWGFVPETILRDDAPLGEGSLQRFVDADFEQHYFTLMEDEQYRPALRRIACFDLVANNADRKGGHCLLGTDGQLWGIDHGLCFHPEPKLRTVMWDFAGEPIDDELLADVRRLGACGLPAGLAEHLSGDERLALAARIRALLRTRRYPHPRSGHPFPWPLV